MTLKRPSAQAVRASGNLALTASLALAILNALSPRLWVATAVIGLSLTGIGARIEAAIVDLARSREQYPPPASGDKRLDDGQQPD